MYGYQQELFLLSESRGMRRGIMYFIYRYLYALRYAQVKYELLFTKETGKRAYAVNSIYRLNHCSVELRVLGINFELDGIIGGTISKDGCATILFRSLTE